MEKNKGWSISIGLYPGILLGFRSYELPDVTMHVVYLPFVDLVLELEQ